MLPCCWVAAVLLVPQREALELCAAPTQAAYKAAVSQLTQVVDIPAAAAAAQQYYADVKKFVLKGCAC
jgi:hypothetical protein